MAEKKCIFALANLQAHKHDRSSVFFRISDQTFEKQKTITEELINIYAGVIGDNNPIHLDEDYARHAIFKTQVDKLELVACFPPFPAEALIIRQPDIINGEGQARKN